MNGIDNVIGDITHLIGDMERCPSNKCGSAKTLGIEIGKSLKILSKSETASAFGRFELIKNTYIYSTRDQKRLYTYPDVVYVCETEDGIFEELRTAINRLTLKHGFTSCETIVDAKIRLPADEDLDKKYILWKYNHTTRFILDVSTFLIRNIIDLPKLSGELVCKQKKEEKTVT